MDPTVIINLVQNMVDFFAQLTDFLYHVLFYQVPVFNTSVLMLVFAVGVGVYVVIMFVSVLKAD